MLYPSFWRFRGVCILCADISEQALCSETSANKFQTPGDNLYFYNYRFSNLVPVILPAFTTSEDGRDRAFRNVHTYNSDPGHNVYLYNYRFSTLVPVILPAFTTSEDGRDRAFRNVDT